MNAMACAALAAAIGCLPASAAVARFAVLWPVRIARRGRRVWTAGPTVLGGCAGLMVAGPGGALAGALVTFTVGRRRAQHRASSAAAAASAQLADAVSRITEELRAGSHPATALGGVRADGPLAREVLGPAAAAARLGDGVASALRRGAAGRPEIGADVERIAVAWSLAERHGVPLAELLARAHDDIRWRVRFGATVRAQLAGPRATASVLTALPLLGIALGQLVGADPIAVLRSGVLGQVMLVVGVALAAAGVTWSEQILRSAVP
ncbi:MAG: tight adherence protein [Pseudonocardiales bacterium]|nr:tight adherence protein [Pseudonocardiales bacterium]